MILYGKITYQVDGITYSSDLLAETSVIASDMIGTLIRIVLMLVTIYLIFQLLKTKPKKTKRGKSTGSKKKYSKRSKHRKSGGGNFRFTYLNNQ